MKKGHIPHRMCLICRQKFVKKDITRYVFSQSIQGVNEGALVQDPKQIMTGRGYYICHADECQERLKRMGGIKRKRKGTKI